MQFTFTVSTQNIGPFLGKLTLDELLLLEAIDKKARGIANWDESLRQREEFQRKCYPGIQQPRELDRRTQNSRDSHTGARDGTMSLASRCFRE
jgi:hypothetical protein